jgi:dynein heavy chain
MRRWGKIMHYLEQDATATKISEIQNLKGDLKSMLIELDKIQKSLDDYLDMKRNKFTRFYFLSNEEMLSILSETKDPYLVQPHLKKCFEGINELIFTPESEVIGMRSAEKEELRFMNKIVPHEHKSAVEEWLVRIEEEMILCIKEKMHEGLVDLAQHTPVREKWLKKWPGQVVLACSQISWTFSVEDKMTVHGNLRSYLEELNGQLQEIVTMVRGNLTPIDLLTLGALVVIEVHARDIVKSLLDDRVSSREDFAWIAQLRYYFEQENMKNIAVKMITTSLNYGFEYLGNSTRLVITPLTDRCYRTLMSALNLNLGGAPEGPAGTGKTETTRDLAKAVAILCLIFNCGKGINAFAMAKFFRGLVSSGSWSCFDEFNRIELEVLSVIAQQIHQIQQAKSQFKTEFDFQGSRLTLKGNPNIFITMNPGYAGRSELPDNLRSLFRPVAMMVPDYGNIAEISLLSMGFNDARKLSKKVVAVYKLCSEQLSYQAHYDYGMRAVKSVLLSAGLLKRKFPEVAEDQLFLQAIDDVNLPKFLDEDIPIFTSILSDLFPDTKLEKRENEELSEAINSVCEKMKIQDFNEFRIKIGQLYEMIQTRHGLMLVGDCSSGKTSTYKVLAAALTEMFDNGSVEQPANWHVINPKSITVNEMYGYSDAISKDWTEGILAYTFKKCSRKPPGERDWIVMDGPVDAEWIENMNTVLDDNKVLCLMNSDKIKMTPGMTMMFETDSLAQASPATVSRCGMIYMHPESIGWWNVFLSWLNTNFESVWTQEIMMHVSDLMDSVFVKTIKYVKSKCNQAEDMSPIMLFHAFSKIFMTMIRKGDLNDASVGDWGLDMFQKRINPLFVFSIMWSIGNTVRDDQRKSFDKFVRRAVSDPIRCEIRDTRIVKFEKNITPPETGGAMVVEYEYDFVELRWIHYREALTKFDSSNELSQIQSFYEIFIETFESLRIKSLLQMSVNYEFPILLIGPTGIGKTQLIASYLRTFNPEEMMTINLTFSARTTSGNVQSIIDGKVEKKRRDTFGPPLFGQKGIIFIDDLNLPIPDQYTYQPPLELTRQYLDQNGWYDLAELRLIKIQDFTLLAAMRPPSGARNPISKRLLKHFVVYSSGDFDDKTMIRIFSEIMSWYNDKRRHGEDHGPMLGFCVEGTVSLYLEILRELKPIPKKCHYMFNLRDLSKIIQGMQQVPPSELRDAKKISRLWMHEVWRVIGDRLVAREDEEWLYSEMSHVLKTKIRSDIQAVLKDGREDARLMGTVDDLKYFRFTDIMSDHASVNERSYDECNDGARLTQRVEVFLENYNIESKKPIDITMFEFAMDQCIRISRVLRLNRGNAALLGLGGSGRQTLTKLATYIMEQELVEIQISKGYNVEAWKEDARKLLTSAA